MKQSLSLRVSQHLSLTPQLQQSIRLLQLSTLEMAQEVEQMLDENPFLERGDELAEREAFGVEVENAPVSTGDLVSEWNADNNADIQAPGTAPIADSTTTTSTSDGDDFREELGGGEPDWEGEIGRAHV